jgi:ATP-dependent Lon protease
MDRDALLAACAGLPLFPLPGAVLMPGAAMPLHVFEPRYRALVRSCLAGSRLLAIPQLQRDQDASDLGQPPIFPYAAAGEIAAHQELPDGRFHLVVRPLARVRIGEDALADGGFRVAKAEVLRDVPGRSAAVARVGARARATFLPVLAGNGAAGRALAQALSGLDDSVAAEALAPLVLRDAAERQAYLAEDDPVARARIVEAAVLLAHAGAVAGAEA